MVRDYLLEHQQLTSDYTSDENDYHSPIAINCQWLLSECWRAQYCACDHSCSEFVSAGARSCPEDSMWQHSPCSGSHSLPSHFPMVFPEPYRGWYGCPFKGWALSSHLSSARGAVSSLCVNPAHCNNTAHCDQSIDRSISQSINQSLTKGESKSSIHTQTQRAAKHTFLMK